MPPIPNTQIHNRILSALPEAEYDHLFAQLEHVEMPLGAVLYHPAEQMQHVYFPNSGTISILAMVRSGTSVEVGMVGNEGMFGIPVALGTVTAPTEAVVQIPGEGLKVRAEVLREEFKRGGILQDIILRYTQAFIIQISQTAVCNSLHSLNARLARWLLMCQDRALSNELPLTHEFIAEMLAVRRAGVTVAAGLLQKQGFINYQRGHITILDRAGLEGTTCECYAEVEEEFQRLLFDKSHDDH
jgi:CRP-like cAMP-binding protein